MIKAEIVRKSNGGFAFRIEGHACYSESGDDIVCAAASGIFYALCGYLSNFRSSGLKVNAIQSGNADIECSSECEEALKQAFLGLWQISLAYPGHLRIINRAWNWHMGCIKDVVA